MSAEANNHNQQSWGQQKLAQLRAEQGQKPPFDPEQFSKEVEGIWPDQDSMGDFLAWLDALRSGKDTSAFLVDPAQGEV